MQKSNAGFYAAAAVVLSLASLFYAWKFILPEYQKKQGQLQNTDKEISAAKIKLDSLSATKNSLDQIGDLVDRLFIAVPEGEDTPNLITEFEAVAAKSGIVIPSIQISDSSISAGTNTGGDVSTASAINTVAVNLSVTGTFPQLNSLLLDFEKDIRFTNVKSLTLTAEKEGQLTMAIQLEVYKRAAIKNTDGIAYSGGSNPAVATQNISTEVK